MRAAEKYDYRRGYGFATYASWWVRSRIGRYISRAPMVHLSAGAAAARATALQAKRYLDPPDGDAPIEAIAEQIGVTATILELALGASLTYVPIPDSRNEDEESLDPVDESALPDDLVATRQFSTRLNALLAELGPRTALILRLRYGLHDGEERTLSEVGNELGLSRERIRQIERAAMLKLRQQVGVRELAQNVESEEVSDDS